METFDANEMELQQVMHLGFDQWALSQQQPTMNNDGSCSSNLTSPTHQDFSQPLESMDVSSAYMLPTPGGSDNNGATDLIVSPYDMMAATSGGVFREEIYRDDGYLFELEPGVLTGTQENTYSNPPYMANGLMSPLTSPNLQPDIATTSQTMRQQQRNNVNKSSRSATYPSNSVRNNNRYTPLKSASTSSTTTSRQKKQRNPQSQEDYDIAITSDMVLPTSTSPIINSSPQDTMPNLNLGDNLVSTIHSTQFTSTPQPSITIPSTNPSPDKISPIAPASLLMLKKPSSSQKQSKTQKDQDQSQSRKQQKVAAADKHQMFMPPSSNGRTTVVMATQPQMIVISPVTPMTPIALAPVSSSSGVGTNSRKTNRQNTNSPVALGPSTNSKSPPTISPNLKPKLPGVLANEVAEQLAQKSNYQTILEGTAESLGISYPSDLQSSLESRRTTHKAAEQKRRDSLKQSFDELKKVLNGNNNASSNREAGGKNDGTIKNASKLFLLNKAHDHIVELEKKNKEKDEMIERLKKEIESLKGKHSEEVECEKGAEDGRPQETPMAIDDAEK